jgi:hypothetical protein
MEYDMKAYFIKTMVFSLILLLSIPAFSQIKNAIRLKVSSATYSDETVVRFLEVATDGFDSDWDAYKLKNGGNTPNFYSFWNSESYAINALKMPFTEREVPLYLEVAFSGTYTITPQILGAFDPSCSITLIDLVLNTTTDLKGLNSYTFNFVKENPANRFVIRFSMPDPDQTITGATSIVQNQFNNPVILYSSEDKVFIDFKELKGTVSITFFQSSGNQIAKEEVVTISSQSKLEFCPPAHGLLIVQIIHGSQKYTQQVYHGSL